MPENHAHVKRGAIRNRPSFVPKRTLLSKNGQISVEWAGVKKRYPGAMDSISEVLSTTKDTKENPDRLTTHVRAATAHS